MSSIQSKPQINSKTLKKQNQRRLTQGFESSGATHVDSQAFSFPQRKACLGQGCRFLLLKILLLAMHPKE